MTTFTSFFAAARFCGRRLLVVPTVAAACLGASAARGERPEASVSGIGSASVERMPERMRVAFPLTAKGDSLAAALAKLKEKRTTTEGALTLLGAEKASIKFGDVNVQKQEEAEEMNRMLMERMGRSRRATASSTPTTGEEKPKSEATNAVVFVTADWPLPTGGPEELLVAVHGLQKKINDADLGGAKEKQKLSPEEEELQAEMQQMMSNSQPGAAKPGAPTFVFVAEIPEEERAKFLAAAFAKAKASAERTAAAAGRKLDKLTAVESGPGGGGDVDGGWSSYPAMSQMRAYYGSYGQQDSGELQAALMGSSDDGKTLAFSRTPGKIKQTFTIHAKFSLAP